MIAARDECSATSEGVSFAKGIKLQEKDIAKDPAALADLKKLGA